MRYSLERFEDDLAVLQSDNEKRVVVLKVLLPPDAKAGEVFRLCDDHYERDTAETIARKNRIKGLQDILRGK